MDFQQFYPTPPELARKLVRLIEKSEGLILEPSAGKGNLLEAFVKVKRYGYFNYETRDIHCVEINSQYAAFLKNKHYVVVWDDFLTFDPLTPYDIIIMNPPFHDGAKHLLKALKILAPDGEIACILNAETIKNPYSNERKDLIRQLEEMESHKIDFVQNAFVDAENPTDVEVALIYAKKKAALTRCITFDDFKKSIVEEQTQDFQAVRRHGEINGLIDNYRAEVQTAFRLYDEIKAYNQISVHSEYHEVFKIEIDFDGKGRRGIVRAINKNYWTKLLYSEELSRLLTSDARCQYTSRINEMADFEFNERNIAQLKMDLVKNLFENVDAAIMKVWATFTRRFSFNEDSPNIHYYDGWITNKAFKVNKKIILPLDAFNRWGGEFEPMYTVNGELSDIEKALNFLDCGRTESADMAEKLQLAQKTGVTRNIDTKYFTVTLYKKGTCHMVFKDLNLLKKLNLYCGKKFNWLPTDYGRKRYSDLNKAEKDIVDSFEGRESYEETFSNQEFYLPQNNPANLLMLTAGKEQ